MSSTVPIATKCTNQMCLQQQQQQQKISFRIINLAQKDDLLALPIFLRNANFQYWFMFWMFEFTKHNLIYADIYIYIYSFRAE